MKLTCDARALRGALDLCTQVTPTKSTMPILSQALLDADELGTLSLHATDLTVRVRASLDARVDERWCALVPARLAAEWLAAVDDLGYPVELELVGEAPAQQRVHWRCGPYLMRTTLLERVTEEWPDAMLRRPDDDPEIELAATALASVLPSLLAVARGREEPVHVVADGEHVTFYTVGSLHAAVAVLRNHGVPQAVAAEWAIPARALSLLQLGDSNGKTLRLGVGDRSAVVWRAGQEVVARLDGQARAVPAIADIAAALRDTPPRTENGLEMERRELLQLLDAGALLGSQADLLYEPSLLELETRARRDDERLQGDTWATAAVLRGPPHRLAVTLECSAVQRLVKSLPGATLGLDLGDVLGGPGLRVSPAEELPDGARVLLVMRAAAGAQVHAEQEEHIDAAA